MVYTVEEDEVDALEWAEPAAIFQEAEVACPAMAEALGMFIEVQHVGQAKSKPQRPRPLQLTFETRDAKKLTFKHAKQLRTNGFRVDDDLNSCVPRSIRLKSQLALRLVSHALAGAGL